MKSMRQMINLMEGVMAVPGIDKKKITEQIFDDPREDKLYSAIAALYGPDIWDNDYMYELVDQLNTGAQPTDQELDQIIATGRLPPRLANFKFGTSDKLQFGSDLHEKSTSEKQARFMAAAAHDPAFAKKAGISQGVAKEFNAADTGTKQLSNAMKHREEESCEMKESVPAVNSCRQENSADADIACAMEEGVGMHEESIADALAQYDEMMSSFVEPSEAIRVIMSWHDGAGCDPEELDAIHNALMDHAGYEGGPDDSMDGDFDSAMASAGLGTDEDYGDYGDPEEFEEAAGDDIHIGAKVHPRWDQQGEPFEVVRIVDDQQVIVKDDFGNNEKMMIKDLVPCQTEVEEAFDLQNGYDDINDASGNDFFPTGADSPVVKVVGPSGARQGDNPEQKKMQVAEVHKELVYGYRNFLKESSQKKKLTESQLVSNLSIKDIGGDFYTTDDGVFLDGGVTASGTAINLQGATVKVTFDIDIKAAAPISWEDDEYPTGWNHKTDSITYSSDYRPEVGVIEVSSVEFSDGMAFYINNEDLYLRDAQNILGPDVMKQLLDPVVYQRLLGPAFDKKVENIDPPEQDHNEPERSDSDFM